MFKGICALAICVDTLQMCVRRIHCAENSTVLAMNLVRVKITCGQKACLTGTQMLLFCRGLRKIPTATHRDGVCIIAVSEKDCEDVWDVLTLQRIILRSWKVALSQNAIELKQLIYLETGFRVCKRFCWE